jgi:phosphoserine phosphatase RsbU/P
MRETREPLRVLVIEDSKVDVELIVLALEQAGIKPEWRSVASAEELRQALAESRWDVVISDYHMRDFDAPAALVIVRDRAGDLPFIIVSGSVGEEQAVLAMKAGANDFFLKDRLDRLGQAIEREVLEARTRAERTAALERLRASEQRLKALVDQVIVGIAQLDRDGRFTLVNQRFSEMTGRSIAELLSMREQDLTHPDDASAALPHSSIEKRYVRPNGTHIWVNASVSKLSDAAGQAVGSVMVIEDVTDRRRSERERERLMKDLERTVKVSEMFAGVLGHDLRNPLMTITMGATLLGRRCAEIGAKDMTEIVTRIARSSDRMRRMIDQLLDFTRIRIGKGIPLVAQHVDLADVARQVIDEIAGADAAHVRLEVHGNVVGDWDRDRLLQLVSNLVANAVHHREPETGVLVRVDGESTPVVRLTVENRGGIPPAILPTIFEPLQTTKNAKRDRASGLGLGLFITRQIARAHGGSIKVDSDSQRGTQFVVELPRAIAESESTLQPTSFEVSVPSSGDTPTSDRVAGAG